MYTVIVRQGNKYDEKYTRALKKQLIELTNTTPLVLGDGFDADIELKHRLFGWWAKMELFSPELKDIRPLFYLDLDTLITQPITLEPVKKFTVCREWSSHDPQDVRCQSSVMSLPEDTDEIWHQFMIEQDRVVNHPGGDQWYLQRFPHDFFKPDFAGSYKFHSRESPKHPIVTFHGNPKQSDPKTGWAYELWKKYAY